jgi:VanZ family protein
LRAALARGSERGGWYAAQSLPLNMGVHCTMPQSPVRAAAWLILAVIALLSLVPPTARPTVAPHILEHAGAFLLDGLAFSVAYPGHERWLCIGAVAFCGGIELAQLMVPGRHARVSDFVVDAVAACIGICAGSVLMRMKEFASSRIE